SRLVDFHPIKTAAQDRESVARGEGAGTGKRDTGEIFQRIQGPGGEEPLPGALVLEGFSYRLEEVSLEKRRIKDATYVDMDHPARIVGEIRDGFRRSHVTWSS